MAMDSVGELRATVFGLAARVAALEERLRRDEEALVSAVEADVAAQVREPQVAVAAEPAQERAASGPCTVSEEWGARAQAKIEEAVKREEGGLERRCKVRGCGSDDVPAGSGYCFDHWLFLETMRQMIDHCKDMPATDATASAKVVRLLLQACLAVIEPDASEPEPRAGERCE